MESVLMFMQQNPTVVLTAVLATVTSGLILKYFSASSSSSSVSKQISGKVKDGNENNNNENQKKDSSKKNNKRGKKHVEAKEEEEKTADVSKKNQRLHEIKLTAAKKNNLLFVEALFKGHTDEITAVDVSANRKFILTASKDRTVRLWHRSSLFESNKRHIRVNIDFDHAETAAFSPDSKYFLVSEAEAKKVSVYKIGKSKEEGINQAISFKSTHDSSRVHSLQVSSVGRFIMAASREKVTLFTLRGELSHVLKDPPFAKNHHFRSSSSSSSLDAAEISEARLSPCSTLLAVCYPLYGVVVYQLELGEAQVKSCVPIANINLCSSVTDLEHAGAVSCDFAPDSSSLVIASAGRMPFGASSSGKEHSHCTKFRFLSTKASEEAAVVADSYRHIYAVLDCGSLRESASAPLSCTPLVVAFGPYFDPYSSGEEGMKSVHTTSGIKLVNDKKGMQLKKDRYEEFYATVCVRMAPPACGIGNQCLTLSVSSALSLECFRIDEQSASHAVENVDTTSDTLGMNPYALAAVYQSYNPRAMTTCMCFDTIGESVYCAGTDRAMKSWAYLPGLEIERARLVKDQGGSKSGRERNKEKLIKSLDELVKEKRKNEKK
eukprot:Nk52_evm32s266 gene=Nk52_evmTU32s266